MRGDLSFGGLPARYVKVPNRYGAARMAGSGDAGDDPHYSGSAAERRGFLMRNDADISRDVMDELRWTPTVDDRDISVKVSDGIVTLSGYVKSLDEAVSAVRAAKRVAGVRALADELIVNIPSSTLLPDPDIARNAAAALERELPHAAQTIRIVVHDGQVTLEGQVEWQYQRMRAEECVRRLAGVRMLSNQITLKGKPLASDIKERIGAALKRSAQIDADGIDVVVDGSQVTLTGRVRSWSEHEEAADTAWAAPGVVEVRNHLCVGP
jgi:osmotically-inducible protein OsmY